MPDLYRTAARNVRRLLIASSASALYEHIQVLSVGDLVVLTNGAHYGDEDVYPAALTYAWRVEDVVQGIDTWDQLVAVAVTPDAHMACSVFLATGVRLRCAHDLPESEYAHMRLAFDAGYRAGLVGTDPRF